MQESLPDYPVEELTLEQAILLLATEEEKRTTDYSRSSERLNRELLRHQTRR